MIILYLNNLYQLFETNSNVEIAEPMAKYMKNRFQFLGIKNPLRKELQKQFFKENGYPEIGKIDAIVRELWSKEEREYHYFAMDLLDKFKNKLPKESIQLYEHLIVTNSWWDSVDMIAAKLVGHHMLKHKKDLSFTTKWCTSDNMWLRRTALLYQLKYKDQTDNKKLALDIEQNLGSNEFFINKAIGWILREYGKTNPSFVTDFVTNHPSLSNLSKKEALRIILKNND